jgi:uncharacterized membrane protein
MAKYRTISFLICIPLLLALLVGLIAQPTALALSSKTAQVSAPLPGQESSGELELTSKFPQIKKSAIEVFSFEIEVAYSGGDEPRFFEFNVTVPDNFNYTLEKSSGGEEIAGLFVDPDKTFSPDKVKLSMWWTSVDLAEPGDYPITVEAFSDEIKDTLELKAIIVARYGLELTTPTGRLNAEATAGKESTFTVILKNLSTVPLEKVEFDTKFNPAGWTVEFEPKEIESLPLLDEQKIEVKITPPDKTIAGDYVMEIKAEDTASNTSEDIEIRVTVLTPTIWGWVGVGIVVLVVIGLMLMFWRLGRR